MIKGIILDFWDTIAYNKQGFGSYIQKIIEVIGEENKEKFYELRREWYTINISEEEFFSKLLKEINKPEAMSEHLLNIWNSQIDQAVLYPETLDVLDSFKKRGIKLFLVSNTVPTGEKSFKNLNLDKYFDFTLFSFKEGIAKPSPFVYKKILDKFNLKPEEVIAVGDKIEADIRGAETYGLKAVLIDRTNKLQYKNKIAELDEIDFYLK